MKKLTLVSVLLLSSLGVFCQGNSKMEKIKKVIEASNATLADLGNKRDGSILTLYSSDACLYPPNSAPICEKEKILAFYNSAPLVQVAFKIQNLYGDAENFVTEESFYTMTDMKGTKLDEGKVIVIWKKTAAGWRMYRDMFSSNYPAKK